MLHCPTYVRRLLGDKFLKRRIIDWGLELAGRPNKAGSADSKSKRRIGPTLSKCRARDWYCSGRKSVHAYVTQRRKRVCSCKASVYHVVLTCKSVKSGSRYSLILGIGRARQDKGGVCREAGSWKGRSVPFSEGLAQLSVLTIDRK